MVSVLEFKQPNHLITVSSHPGLTRVSCLPRKMGDARVKPEHDEGSYNKNNACLKTSLRVSAKLKIFQTGIALYLLLQHHIRF